MDTPTQLFNRLHETIRTTERVLLVAHKKPDGDTLGASSSMHNWLLREGKYVKTFCRDLPPQQFCYLDNIHHYTTDEAVFDEAYDLVIVFDSGDLRYCGIDELIPRLPKPYLLVNLDHHVTNVRFGELNVVLTDASSTAEVVYRFYEDNNISIDSRMATSLLTGLVTDTSHFSNAATTSKSMEAAGRLLAHGARLPEILKHVLHNKSIEGLKAWGLMLSRLAYNPRYDVVTTYILAQEIGIASSEIVEGMSNFLNAVLGNADAILVLRELPNGQIKGSMRSIGRDISRFAKLLGGGGHKKAAGFTVDGRIEVTPQGARIIPSSHQQLA